MAKKQVCYKCNKEFELTKEKNYWSNAEHLPFDTLQKLKKIISTNYICKQCMQKLQKKIEN